jgi:hypothetical protein
MKKIGLLIGILFVLSGYEHPDKLATWVVMQGSSLMVNGITNVNSFQCEITNYSSPDTLTCAMALPKGMSLPMNGKLNLNIEAFDCHNRMMTNDLRKTLKAKIFPILSVRFISINGYPDLKNPGTITGVVDIGLAGVIRRFDINYLFTMDNLQQLHLKGDRVIKFSEFNLMPPSKLGGVIKAKDELNVEFKLNLKTIAQSN